MVILFIHIALTWTMAGIIWYVQLVHYPLFKQIKEGFVNYEKRHIRRSGYLMGPLMLAEFITAIFLFGWAKNGLFSKLTTLNLFLLIFIWMFTLLFQTNQLKKLSIHFSVKLLNVLIFSNWFRTVLWSARAILMFFLIEAYPGF